MESNIVVRVDIPALSELVGFLREKYGMPAPGKLIHGTTCTEKVIEANAECVEAATAKPAKVVETEDEWANAVQVKPAKAKKVAPKQCKSDGNAPEGPEPKAPDAESDKAEENAQPETPKAKDDVRDYPAADIAKAALALRDQDPENTKRITAEFPKFGIRSLGDLRSKDVQTRYAFATMLIGLGAKF